MLVRPADADDGPILLDALYEAVNWRGDEAFTRDRLLSTPEIAHYVLGWRRDGDFGVVAMSDDGTPLGAAWCRLLDAADAGYGFVAPDVPELTIAVFPGNRGQGIGTRLLAAILDAAGERGHQRVSLSVEDGNAARRLYESVGFAPVGRNGDSDTLVASTARP